MPTDKSAQKTNGTDNIQDILKSSLARLQNVDNVLFTCVVDARGEVVDSYGGLEESKLRAYAAMCATIFGANRKANDELNIDPPSIIISNDSAGKNYIKGLGRSYILVARTKRGNNYDEIEKTVEKEGNLLTQKWLRNYLMTSLKKKYK